MSSTKSIIREIYEQAYKQGWHDHRDQTGFFGAGPRNPGTIEVPDTGDWKKRLMSDGVDTTNIYHVKETRWNSSYQREYLYYSAERESKEEVELLLAEKAGRNIREFEVTGDVAGQIRDLREKVRDLFAENEALRATHPGAETEWAEDPEDLEPTANEEWALEPVLEPDTRTVLLDGSHVFDKAEVEFDIDVSATAEGKGEINVAVDIERVELVSTN